MEKSRAVLLNDKLNELGASAHLPAGEAKKEQEFQIDVLNQQQKLALFDESENEYKTQQLKYLSAKEKLENYIGTLEKKYPSYYHYRYADDVVALNALQQYLKKNKQSFVHYFINDTVAYILSITPQNTKLVKFSKDSFNVERLKNFLRLCSDKQNLNNNYQSFVSLSYSLYQLLFHPLNIPKGRIVICPDNFLIPFEALCTSANGSDFLINNYSFSYIYSARYLLKKYETQKTKGDFIGFAPVSFNSCLDVPDLKNSAEALKQSAKYYHNTSLLLNSQASRHNFLSSIASYSVVNVLSHANADSAKKEPLLFMQDSIISLSELQLIHNPATQLVILSACETNAGKNAKGEGIFSFARGFATAGIPSVAATLWKADEKTIYDITQKFHEYLSQGMHKDEALQKAKLSFIQNADSENQLPYYWANLILTGNDEPLQLSRSQITWPFIITLTAFGIIAMLVIIFVKRKKQNSKQVFV
jgi:CHAT domain-containing protein